MQSEAKQPQVFGLEETLRAMDRTGPKPVRWPIWAGAAAAVVVAGVLVAPILNGKTGAESASVASLAQEKADIPFAEMSEDDLNAQEPKARLSSSEEVSSTGQEQESNAGRKAEPQREAANSSLLLVS